MCKAVHVLIKQPKEIRNDWPVFTGSLWQVPRMCASSLAVGVPVSWLCLLNILLVVLCHV